MQPHANMSTSCRHVNISPCLWLQLVTEAPVGIWIRDKFKLKIDRSVKTPWQEYGVAAGSWWWAPGTVEALDSGQRKRKVAVLAVLAVMGKLGCSNYGNCFFFSFLRRGRGDATFILNKNACCKKCICQAVLCIHQAKVCSEFYQTKSLKLKKIQPIQSNLEISLQCFVVSKVPVCFQSSWKVCWVSLISNSMAFFLIRKWQLHVL